MNRKSQTVLSLIAALFASLAIGGVAQAAPVKGTVVHRIASAHAFVVADRQGRMVAIHAVRSPAVGRSVRVDVRRLRNGRLAATRITVGRRARSARIRGTVTFANRSARTFVVSARGVSLLVHRAAARGARARSAAVAGGVPAVGTIVTVDANLDQQGEVQADNVDEQGTDTGVIDLEGVITGIDPAAHRLRVSADDDGVSGATITVQLPATFDLATFSVGDTVELHVTLNADGTYTAVYSSKDNSADDADDTSDDQGVNEDDAANQHDDASQASPSSPSDPTARHDTSSQHDGDKHPSGDERGSSQHH
jgi:hypothetical protein